MREKLKAILMNSWTITIGGGVIATLLVTVITDIIKKKKIFSTIGVVVNKCINIIIKFLNIEIKLWWILLGLGLLVIIKNLVKRISIMIDQSVKEEPEPIRYEEDTILKYKWRWIWEKTYDGKYRIENLQPICSKCGTPLPEDIFFCGGGHKCIRCGNANYESLPEISNVLMMIEDNARRGKYHIKEK